MWDDEKAVIDNKTIIQEIVELELEMFLNVAAREPASCQQNPDGFRFYRATTFSTWSREPLMSYLADLQRAKAAGENLITQKYARMEGLIEKRGDNELLDKIVDIEVGWVKELSAKYPNLHKKARPVEDDGPSSTSMKTYLRGELETYSDTTLSLYYQHVRACAENNENLAEKKCLAMVSRAGFNSLEDAESKLSAN